jgi:hypothetical protein
MINLSRYILAVCLLTILVLLPVVVSAQPGNPGDPDAPITGIEILIGIGGWLGIKKLYQSRKKNNPWP